VEDVAPADECIGRDKLAAERLRVALVAIAPGQAESGETQTRLLHSVRRIEHAHIDDEAPLRGPVDAGIDGAVFDVDRSSVRSLERYVASGCDARPRHHDQRT